jgi:hypothetical protein
LPRSALFATVFLNIITPRIENRQVVNTKGSINLKSTFEIKAFQTAFWNAFGTIPYWFERTALTPIIPVRSRKTLKIIVAKLLFEPIYHLRQ